MPLLSIQELDQGFTEYRVTADRATFEIVWGVVFVTVCIVSQDRQLVQPSPSVLTDHK